MVKKMTNKILARMKVETPLGTVYNKGDEIDKSEYVDYVKEITSLIVDSEDGAACFENEDGEIVFIMPEILKNSIITVEKY